MEAASNNSPSSIFGSIAEASQLHSPVGLIAGNGTLPAEFIKGAKAIGLEVVAVAVRGEANPEIERDVIHCAWVKVGELGKLIRTFNKYGVQNAAFAGGVKRIKLFGGVKLDLRAIALVTKLRSMKDDSLLRAVAAELETSGIKVFSPHLLLGDTIPSTGYLTIRHLNRSECEDARVGWEAAAGIGALDIGQSVVVAEGLIVAVEAMEGTDRCIERAASLASKASACVVVKRAKPQQDTRLDLPTIGPETIATLSRCGIKALVVEAGKCMILDRGHFIQRADAAGISVLCASSSSDIS